MALRLPVYCYRLRLGWLLGHRFLMLTHLGRKSGRLHQTVLEVVRYDPTGRESIVASAWGGRSDWYRNIQASPAVEVQTGGERYRPAQRFLSADEVYAEIHDYEQRHPVLVRLIARWLGFRSRRAFASALRLVAFRPKGAADSQAADSGRAD